MGTLATELAPHAEQLSPRPRIYADANEPAVLIDAGQHDISVVFGESGVHVEHAVKAETHDAAGCLGESLRHLCENRWRGRCWHARGARLRD